MTTDFAGYEEIKERYTRANGQTVGKPKQAWLDGDNVTEPERATKTWKQPDADYVRRKLSLADWLTRDIAEPDFMMGEVVSTTSRILVVGPTGLGKTNFGVALAIAIAGGRGFLHWRAAQGPRRVLYVDGEMPERLMRGRLQDAVRRLGQSPESLFTLSREDFPDMPPLDTVAGQDFIDHITEASGGVDLAIFDNIQSLTISPLKEEEGWRLVTPWTRELTRRKVGQIWFHHTGHDESRSYGDKQREWQMDTVALMERVERPKADVAFRLAFPKCRQRTPDNRTDYEPAIITLQDDEWHSERGSGRKMSKPAPLARKFYDAIIDAVIAKGVPRPESGSRPSVTKQEWEAECIRLGLIDANAADSRRALMSKNRRELIAASWLDCNGDYVWPTR